VLECVGVSVVVIMEEDRSRQAGSDAITNWPVMAQTVDDPTCMSGTEPLKAIVAVTCGIGPPLAVTEIPWRLCTVISTREDCNDDGANCD